MVSSHARRKLEHLRICTEEDVSARLVTSGLERYRLMHCALPELDLSEIDLGTTFLDHHLAAPLLISAITGGTVQAQDINRNLAEAAQALGIAMCVGSQRTAIEDPQQIATYQVRSIAPDILLFANLGAVQLNYGYGLAECQRAVEMIGADALMLHLNPLQEALQPEGNINFTGLLDKIASICRDMDVPVVVKEVGWGISEPVAAQLASIGIAALDVAGAGGTSWSEVEKLRARDALQERVAADFENWGIPTAEAIAQARQAAPSLPLIASGGIRTGPEIAIALALGADLAGLAGPLVGPATVSPQAVQEELTVAIRGLRVSMFSSGLPDIRSLKNARLEQAVTGDPQ